MFSLVFFLFVCVCVCVTTPVKQQMVIKRNCDIQYSKAAAHGEKELCGLQAHGVFWHHAPLLFSSSFSVIMQGKLSAESV